MQPQPVTTGRYPVRETASPIARAVQLARRLGERSSFGADASPPEGFAEPIDAMRDACGTAPCGIPAVFGADAHWLLGE